MRDIKRVIIPVDNTENSKKAVTEGVFLAKLLGVKANIITVNDTHQFISSVVLEEKLRKEASAFLDDLKKIAEDSGVFRKGQVEISELPLQQDLANMAGTSRETISRVIKSLTDDGFLRKHGGKIIIVDYERFQMKFSK